MLRSKLVKFLMSVLIWQVNFFSNFVSFFIFITHNFSINFMFIHFLLWIKRSYQSHTFETLECSGEKLQNSSCHFPNHQSVFLQILHLSSVWWKIIPLYFFSSNMICFFKKDLIKLQIFQTFECSGQSSSNSFCQFWRHKSISLQIPSQVKKYRIFIYHYAEGWCKV